MASNGTPNTGNTAYTTPLLSSTPASRLMSWTPSRRAISADPLTSQSRRRSSLHTPTENLARLTVSSNRRSASGRKVPTAVVARTPHGKAAMRTLDLRRAAVFTPGGLRERRRRSVRDSRETPRDNLRLLSRVLAKNTAPIPDSSSSSSSPSKKQDETPDITIRKARVSAAFADDDEDFPIDRPRLSLPITEDDEDESTILAPHRSSGLILDEEPNFTVQSIEMGRRAVSEQPLPLATPGSRASLGSILMSDFLDEPMGMGTPEVGIDSGFFPPPAYDAIQPEESSIERVDDVMVGRSSDVGLGSIHINDSTVMIDAQPRDSTSRFQSPSRLDSPSRLPGILEDREAAGVDDDDDDNPEQLDQGGNSVDSDDASSDVNELTREMTDRQLRSDSEERNIVVTRRSGSAKKKVKVSKYGIEYPSLPQATMKRLATTLAQQGGAGKVKLTPDTMSAISQASDWFFQQLGDHLANYARHAGRRTIDESDMAMMFRRYVKEHFP